MVRYVKRIGAIALTFLLLFINVPTSVSAATLGNQQSNIQNGLTLHCWNWSYKNIEANMELIAKQGYTAIQTSPIQQSKEGTKGYSVDGWWVYYQPMGFHIDNTGRSALGTKAEFVSMCKTAHEYGVKVIVDVVANHLGNQSGNDLSNAIITDIKNDPSCWHDYTKNTYDYTKRYDITQWCMNGLPDLNTGSKKVQNYVLDFLKECIDAGADGFRFDAAKHIETPDDGGDSCASDFWPTIVNGAKEYAKSTRGIDLYCYGELLDNPGGSLPVSSYTKYINVTDNVYSNNLRNYVNKGWANEAGSPFYAKAAGAGQLVLWAESHDTWAAEESIWVSNENINKTWAIVASRSDAMGLYFARPNSKSTMLGVADVTGWSYEEVKDVNLFHNAFVGQSEYMSTENGVVYCERGTTGVVLVNCVGNGANVNVTAHAMKDGTYTDQVSGTTFTVSNGRISGTIGSTGIAVVYNAQANNTNQTGNNVAYIELPSGWSTKVYCYAYDSATGSTNNAEWPGVLMTHVSGNIYKYEVPSNIKDPRVIFYSSDTNRFPGELGEGLLLNGSMIYSGGNWKEYNVDTYGKVVVKYVDENGKTIATSTTQEGKTGTSYSVSAKDIAGYDFVRVEGKASGTYSDGTITITYIYEKTDSESGENITEDDSSQSSESDNDEEVTNPSESESTNNNEQSTADIENDNTGNNTDNTAEDNTSTENSGSGDKGGEDKKEFPWPAVVVPVACIAVAGVVAVVLYKKRKEQK